MVRSATSATPLVEVTTVDTPPRFSRPTIESTPTVVRDVAARVKFWLTVDPSSRRKVTVTGAGDADGFAIATSRSKKLPVAPSASE